MPLAHATLNGILRGEPSSPSPVRKITDMTCAACSKDAPALLQTPHGWVCSKCYKLVYVPIPTKEEIKQEFPYNTIDSYLVEVR